MMAFQKIRNNSHYNIQLHNFKYCRQWLLLFLCFSPSYSKTYLF